jgi:hypothetical protein
VQCWEVNTLAGDQPDIARARDMCGDELWIANPYIDHCREFIARSSLLQAACRPWWMFPAQTAASVDTLGDENTAEIRAFEQMARHACAILFAPLRNRVCGGGRGRSAVTAVECLTGDDRFSSGLVGRVGATGDMPRLQRPDESTACS